MAKKMKYVTLFLGLIFIFLLALYLWTKNSLVLTLLITSATSLYHFAMRLAVGHTVNAILKNNVDYTRKWFKPKKWEEKLFTAFNIKKLKYNAPTYSPKTFDLHTNSLEEIIKATCQAEIVHEIIILLSFLPIIAYLFFGALWVFIITSLISACVDAYFVLIQRYNRPRLVNLLQKQQNKNQKTAV
jgi:hypothetical protein